MPSAKDRGQDQQDGQGDGVLGDHRGSPLRAARTALRRAVRAAPVFRPACWGQGGADLRDAIKGNGGERAGPFGDQIKEPGGLGRLPRDRLPALARAGRSRRRGGARGAAAGGDRAFLEDPGAEPGQGGGGGQGQAQQPQDQPADHGQRGGLLASDGAVQLLVAGQHPGADDADQGVAGQGVGDGGHGPDGQVPPARRGRDDVHEHAGADRGQVQRPGAKRAAAVQGQGDAEAGEDQSGRVRDRGFQGRDRGQVAGGVDHPVLGGEAHRSGGRGQDAQPGGRVAQPPSGTVLAGRSGPGAGGYGSVADFRDGLSGRAG